MSNPAPLCVSRLGTDWNDAGTLCRSRSSRPGCVGLAEEALCRPSRRDPFASIQRSTAALVYSKAKEAGWKRRFDEEMAGSGIQVAQTSGLYWRSLIGCLIGTRTCKESGGIQFYLIRGGYEGFLTRSLMHVDANQVHWDGRKEGTTDLNDALVILDTNGNCLGAFQLAVPNYYPRTARMVAGDWDGRAVFAYYNTNNNWNYYALAVLDRGKLPKWDPKVGKYNYWIDIHHKGGTYGCIEVVRSAFPGASNFDSFVARIIKKYGRPADEKFIRGTQGYTELDPTAGESKSHIINVPMKHYLGRIVVLDLPI